MHEQVKELLIIHEKLERMHRTLYSRMQAIEGSTKNTPMKQHDRVDSIYLMRLLEELLDDTRKEIKRTKELLERITCITWAKDINSEPTIRGRLCRGKPDVSKAAKIPSKSKNPEEFAALMSSLNIPQDMVELGVVKPHWPNLVQYLTAQSAEGKPFPPGIDPTTSFDVYKVTCTKNRNLDLDEVRKQEIAQ